MNNDKSATSQYIKRVTFVLPRIEIQDGIPKFDYQNSPIIHTINKAPFVLEQESHIDFFITIYIEFHEWTGIKEIEPIVH